MSDTSARHPFAQPETEYFAFLAEGKFMLPRAKRSGRVFFPPRIMEPGTGDTDLEWIEASGRGTVAATSVMRVRPPAPPYNVALIDLAEGPRLMSRVEGIAPDAVQIGQAVKARIDASPDGPILIFVPDA